jgi:GntR family transcriptional regulator/MocR family aminotransferase
MLISWFFASRLSQSISRGLISEQMSHVASTTHLGGLLEVHAPEGGLNLVGWLPPGKDDRRASRLAAQVGIEIMTISTFSLEPLPRGGLLFGYARTDEEAILHGVKTLAAALEQL